MKLYAIANLLNCKVEDLDVLERCGMDMKDLATRYIQKTGAMPGLNDLIEESFVEGINIIYRAYTDKVIDVNKKRDWNIPVPEVEVADLAKLSFTQDFAYTADSYNSNIRILNNAEIYHKYFQDAIEEAEAMMGYHFKE